MNIIKKSDIGKFVVFVLFFCIVSVFVVPNNSFAQPGAGGGTGAGPTGTGGGTGSGRIEPLQNPLSKDLGSVGAVIQKFLEIFSYIVILFAVLLIIWVGFRFILSRGNPIEMKKNGMWLTWIMCGVAIVLGARLLVYIVINTLEKTGTVNKGVTESAKNALNPPK